MEIIKAYAEYVVAHNMFIDKYLPNKDESECQEEIAISDAVFQNLEDLIFNKYDDFKAYDIMEALCSTNRVTKKLEMDINILVYFEIIA